jgi:mRNA interferase RelE/StbE
MGKIEQQLRKIPELYRERIFLIVQKLQKRDFSELDRKKLKGYDSIFRIRIGNYRIIYQDDSAGIILKAILKRDENTYADF